MGPQDEWGPRRDEMGVVGPVSDLREVMLGNDVLRAMVWEVSWCFRFESVLECVS